MNSPSRGHALTSTGALPVAITIASVAAYVSVVPSRFLSKTVLGDANEASP